MQAHSAVYGPTSSTTLRKDDRDNTAVCSHASWPKSRSLGLATGRDMDRSTAVVNDICCREFHYEDITVTWLVNIKYGVTAVERVHRFNEQHTVRFLWAKGLCANAIHSEMCPVYDDNRLPSFEPTKMLGGQISCAPDTEVGLQWVVRHWLKQQTASFFCIGTFRNLLTDGTNV